MISLVDKREGIKTVCALLCTTDVHSDTHLGVVLTITVCLGLTFVFLHIFTRVSLSVFGLVLF